MKQENRPPTLLPMQFEKIMYCIKYNKQNDMLGVFRTSSGKLELNEYFQYIAMVDMNLLDATMLSSLLKKFMRETTKPLWPEKHFSQLIEITKEYTGDIKSKNQANNNISLWKMKFRKLYSNVDTTERTFLEYLISLCLHIVNDPSSKMDIPSLAVCIAPGLIRRTPTTTDVTEVKASITSFQNMLSNANELFSQLQMKFIDSRKNEILKPVTFYSQTFNESKKKFNIFKVNPISRTSLHRRTSILFDTKGKK